MYFCVIFFIAPFSYNNNTIIHSCLHINHMFFIDFIGQIYQVA